MQILGYHLDLIRNSVGVLTRNSVAFNSVGVLTRNSVAFNSPPGDSDLTAGEQQETIPLRSLFVKNDKAVLSSMPKVQLVQKKNPFFNL